MPDMINMQLFFRQKNTQLSSYKTAQSFVPIKVYRKNHVLNNQQTDHKVKEEEDEGTMKEQFKIDE